MPRRKKRPTAGLTSRSADPHLLYERSVQETETTIDFIDSVFEDERGRLPLSLREDFCGTAKLAADWVLRGPRRRAVGLDIDLPTLDWARRHNLEPLGEDARRVELLHRDVRLGSRRKFDVVAAFNFSYWVFQQRDELKRYFTACRRGLKPGGALMLDLHAGPDAQFQLEERADYGDFEYVWEQETFNPFNNHTICHIHFRFPDGSALERAFTYDWRVWSVPELRDLLAEVGFRRVDEWWDGSDDDELVRLRPDDANFISWLAYVVAWK